MCKTSKQVSQNQFFPNNRNKFFRNLGKEHISVEKPPKKEPTETFWHSLLENNGEYNHSTGWIEERGAETECQPWKDISQDELQTALKKTSNWKSPGSDVVLNFWLKQLTTLHQNLNVYNQAVETPKICLIGSQQHKHTNYQRTKTQRTPKTLDQLPVYQHPLKFSHRF